MMVLRKRLETIAAAPLIAVVGALLLHPAPVVGQEVASPEASMLNVTSNSAEATKHFWSGIDDVENIFFIRSARHLQRAFELDASLGLAHVVYGWGAPGLQQSERARHIARGLSAMGSASTAELVVATAFKEWNANNPTAAKQLFGTAAKMVPEDPHVAYFHAWVSGQGPGNQPAGLMAMRKVTERFPDFPGAYNILAYGLWNTGDHDGALTAVRTYAKLLPEHPNPHDSYAELLQWDGRFEEAARHYRKALELDADYSAAYHGLAEVQQLLGNNDAAIDHLTQAIDHAPTAQARVNFRRALANGYWLNGNRRAAMEQLGMTASEATTGEFNNLAALAHQTMAVIDATDRGRNIATHLDAAAKANAPDTPAQHYWTALAYATAGNVAMAQAAASKLETAVKDAPGWQTGSRVANAMVLLGEKRVPEAMQQLEQADPDNVMVRALMAECYAAMGNKVQARAFKADVLDERQLNFFSSSTPLARRIAANVK